MIQRCNAMVLAIVLLLSVGAQAAQVPSKDEKENGESGVLQAQKIFSGKGISGKDVILRVVTHEIRVAQDKNKNDITKLTDVDVIVNAANEQCLGGSGVDGAVHKAADRGQHTQLANFIKENFPVLEDSRDVRCKTGQAIATPAFGMEDNKFLLCVGKDADGKPIFKEKKQNIKCIVHAVGPRYDSHRAALLLRSVYSNSLDAASKYPQSEIAQKYAQQQRKNGKGLQELVLSKIAFPSISTGVFGYPKEEAAVIALGSVAEKIEQGNFPFEEVRFVLWPDTYEPYKAALDDYKNLSKKMESFCMASWDRQSVRRVELRNNSPLVNQSSNDQQPQLRLAPDSNTKKLEDSWWSSHWRKVLAASSLLALVGCYIWWMKR